MKQVSFAVEKITDEETGQSLDALVKTTTSEGKETEKETWCTVLDLDRLFAACVSRWQNNWNLDKVVVAIQESSIE